MKTINHRRDASNNVNILQRKYLGNGRFYLRGHFKGAEIGDIITSDGAKIDLKIDKIISVNDSACNGLSENDKKQAHVELECFYADFTIESQFNGIRPNDFGN